MIARLRTAAAALPLLASILGCALPTDGDDDPEVSETTDTITSAGAWYQLDAANGLGPATVTVLNGYKVTCPDGSFARTCHVTGLVLPPDCGWECQDGVLSLQGDTVFRGRFAHGKLVVSLGLDTFTHSAGLYSVYRLTAAPSCAGDPCPGSLSAQKLNIASTPVTVKSVDFLHAQDPNYVLDPTRGDDQAFSKAGLIVSGHIVSHVFRAERVWRLETPRPACEPQLVARAHASNGIHDVVQFRTLTEAEHATAPDGGSVYWVVRTGEAASTVTFTWGINDLWAERFVVAKAGCAVTVVAEH